MKIFVWRPPPVLGSTFFVLTTIGAVVCGSRTSSQEKLGVKGKLSQPRLVSLYHAYLHNRCAADFIRSVSLHYTVPSLRRMMVEGDAPKRRAATLALGFLAGYEANQTLGPALHDPDRGVRLLVENALRAIWPRDGALSQQWKLRIVARYNRGGQYPQAEELASSLISQAPWFAEAWNQRAIARFCQEQYRKAAEDCHRALEHNPFHWPAAIGMANCFLESDDRHSALACFRRALEIYPDLEIVRLQAASLRRTLED